VRYVAVPFLLMIILLVLYLERSHDIKLFNISLHWIFVVNNAFVQLIFPVFFFAYSQTIYFEGY